MDPVQFINKWVHLLSIIGMLGGTALALLVLQPALKDRAEDPDAKAIWRRYGIIQAVLWVLLLTTGFINQYFVTPSVIGRYQMFLGMKIMLALLMFVLAMLAAHPVPGMDKLTRNKAPWLTAILLMGVLAVGISAYLNMGRVSGELKKPAVSASAIGATPGAR